MFQCDFLITILVLHSFALDVFIFIFIFINVFAVVVDVTHCRIRMALGICFFSILYLSLSPFIVLWPFIPIVLTLFSLLICAFKPLILPRSNRTKYTHNVRSVCFSVVVFYYQLLDNRKLFVVVNVFLLFIRHLCSMHSVDIYRLECGTAVRRPQYEKCKMTFSQYNRLNQQRAKATDFGQ